MEFLDIVKLILQYAVAPLAVVVWSMYKKHDVRLDRLEDDTNITREDIIELRATVNQDIKYMSKNIDDIKASIQRLVDRK